MAATGKRNVPVPPDPLLRILRCGLLGFPRLEFGVILGARRLLHHCDQVRRRYRGFARLEIQPGTLDFHDAGKLAIGLVYKVADAPVLAVGRQPGGLRSHTQMFVGAYFVQVTGFLTEQHRADAELPEALQREAAVVEETNARLRGAVHVGGVAQVAVGIEVGPAHLESVAIRHVNTSASRYCRKRGGIGKVGKLYNISTKCCITSRMLYTELSLTAQTAFAQLQHAVLAEHVSRSVAHLHGNFAKKAVKGRN